MIRPPYLQPGNTIAICCPSGYMDRSKVADAISTFHAWGLQVIVGDTVGKETHNYFAGTDEERLSELQSYIDNPNVHAIMMGRGGYGMSRIIDGINWDKFIKNPKWICGFSDITLLHNHLQALGYQSMHSPMCAAFIPDGSMEQVEMINAVRDLLFGNPMQYPTIKDASNVEGIGNGRLMGGNLAMVTHALGSPSSLKTDHCILFLEDVGEHLYKIDRMLWQLKRAGLLSHLTGMVYGQFSDAEDTVRPFGSDLKDILLAHVRDYDYPVCFNFPAGHESINFPLLFGANYSLKVTGEQATLRLL